MLAVIDVIVAVYPAYQTADLLHGRPTRARLLHWLIWWYLWALLLYIDTITLGWLPLCDLLKLAVLLPNYSIRCTSLSAKLLLAVKRHVATLTLFKTYYKRLQDLSNRWPALASWIEQVKDYTGSFSKLF